MAKQRDGAGKRPAKTLSAWTGAGHVQVAVWANESEERVTHSVTCKRRYKQDDEYKDGQTYFSGDLLALAELLRQAWAWIGEQSQQEKSHE